MSGVVDVKFAEMESNLPADFSVGIINNEYSLPIVFENVGKNGKTEFPERLKWAIQDYIPGPALDPTPEPTPDPLPDGYTLLEYIESSGTQYIDTGYKATTDNLRISIEFAYTSVAAAQSIFGAQSSTGAPYGVIPYTAAASTPMLYVASSSRILSVSVSAEVFNIWDLTAANGTATWVYNGTTQTASYSGTPNQEYPYFIFANNMGGTAGQMCSAKLKSMQMYDNGALVRDFIPCIDPTGEIGLFDTVGSKFYGNAGTGVFVAGRLPVDLPDGYTQLEYLQSDGSQYIDTGFVPNQNSRITLDYQNEGTSFASLCGSQAAANTSSLLFYLNSTTVYPQYGDCKLAAYEIAETTSNRLIYDLSASGAKVGNNSVSVSAANFSAGCNAMLFVVNIGGTLDARKAVGKLYSCQIYDNGNLVRDYVPCKNPSGVYGLYDMVTETFYTNAGSGSFTGA